MRPGRFGIVKEFLPPKTPEEIDSIVFSSIPKNSKVSAADRFKGVSKITVGMIRKDKITQAEIGAAVKNIYYNRATTEGSFTSKEFRLNLRQAVKSRKCIDKYKKRGKVT